VQHSGQYFGLLYLQRRQHNKMIHSTLWSVFFFFTLHLAHSQKFSRLEADFSILEKNTLIDSSYLVVGKINYDLSKDEAIYTVNFPERVYYEFKDTIRTIYDSLHNTVKVDTVGLMNETFVFKKILTDKLSDFDLKLAGFTVTDVTKYDQSVVFEYSPPPQMKFVSTVYLQKIENQIAGIVFIDVDGKQFNKTYYEDYVNIKNIAVPTKIKSQFTGVEQQVFKELQLRNIQIH